MTYPPWQRIFSSIWYGLLGVIVVYELFCWLDRKDQTPPLTHVLVTEVPPWVILPICIWLATHFSVRYYQGLAWWYEIVLTVATFVVTYWKR